jgi:hypothetical protein
MLLRNPELNVLFGVPTLKSVETVRVFEIRSSDDNRMAFICEIGKSIREETEPRQLFCEIEQLPCPWSWRSASHR